MSDPARPPAPAAATPLSVDVGGPELVEVEVVFDLVHGNRIFLRDDEDPEDAGAAPLEEPQP